MISSSNTSRNIGARRSRARTSRENRRSDSRRTNGEAVVRHTVLRVVGHVETGQRGDIARNDLQSLARRRCRKTAANANAGSHSRREGRHRGVAGNGRLRTAEGFRKLSRGCQREYNVWLTTAKRPETKARRLKETLAALVRGRKWAQRKPTA